MTESTNNETGIPGVHVKKITIEDEEGNILTYEHNPGRIIKEIKITYGNEDRSKIYSFDDAFLERKFIMLN